MEGPVPGYTERTTTLRSGSSSGAPASPVAMHTAVDAVEDRGEDPAIDPVMQARAPPLEPTASDRRGQATRPVDAARDGS